MLANRQAASGDEYLMRKPKPGRRKKLWKRGILVACAVLLAIPLCLTICSRLTHVAIMLLIYDEIYHMKKEPTGPGRPPDLIETFQLPVNSDEPILTQNQYSSWVNVTISGTIDLGGGRYHDALWHCDAEGSCERYRGLHIHGRYAFALSRYPKHFSHDGYEYIYKGVGDTPRHIAFQLITDDFPEASGALEVEVFYPWYSFNRGGGR